MSRDVFYLVPSESDGRQEQQQQAATTSERVNAERTHEANATNPDIDRIEPIDTQSQEPPMIQPLLKERVYFAAKDGLPIALLSLLSNIESDALKNAYINQVSHADGFYFTLLPHISFQLIANSIPSQQQQQKNTQRFSKRKIVVFFFFLSIYS